MTDESIIISGVTTTASGAAHPFVDVHAHFLTERYCDEASRAGHPQPDGMPAWPQWSRSRQLRLMDSLGIDVAMLSISSPGVHFGDDAAAVALARHVNDEAVALAAGSGGRLEFLAALPLPDVAASVAELRRLAGSPGFRGAVVLSQAGGHYPGEPRFDPVWSELEAQAGVVLVHPTSPPGWQLVSPDRPRPAIEFPFETTRAAASLMEHAVPQRFSQIRFILPHCGGALSALIDRLELFRLAGLMGDQPEPLTDALGRFWFDTAGSPFPALLPALRQHVGAERLLYGSDFCFTPPVGVALQLGALDAAQPPAGWPNWRAGLAANAAALLGSGSSQPAIQPPPGRWEHYRRQTAQRVFQRIAGRVLLGDRSTP
jgi:6-methylsalicylate decarboxylase